MQIVNLLGKTFESKTIGQVFKANKKKCISKWQKDQNVDMLLTSTKLEIADSFCGQVVKIEYDLPSNGP